MNSVNQKFNWPRFISVLGISFASIALIGIVIIILNWSDLYHLNIHSSILNFVLPFMAAAWIGELICGILILKQRKVLGRILIAIGIFTFIFMQLIPAQS
jgi:hypothetical protein